MIWTVTTDDDSTLIHLARAGKLISVRLTFSWRFFRWMYKMKVLMVLLLFFSCAEETYYSIDPQLQPYLERFYSEAQDHGYHFKRANLILRPQQGLLDKGKAYGRTIRNIGMLNGDQVEVQIDANFLQQHANDSTCIESVLFHEFGHAFLHREHTSSFSFMNNGMTCQVYLKDVRQRLIEELFTP